MSDAEPMHLMLGPVRLLRPVLLAPEPGDAPNLRVGLMTRRAGADKVFVRGAWRPDVWEALKGHPRWTRPFMLFVSAHREDPGVVLHVHLAAPSEMLPDGIGIALNPDTDGEEWRGVTDDTTERVRLIPVGILVRYEHGFKHGGTMPDEALDLLECAAGGGTVEPFVQGLGL